MRHFLAHLGQPEMMRENLMRKGICLIAQCERAHEALWDVVVVSASFQKLFSGGTGPPENFSMDGIYRRECPRRSVARVRFLMLETTPMAAYSVTIEDPP